MNNKTEIRTVLGKRSIAAETVTLSHEHICCYSEYIAKMSCNYFDKEELICKAVEVLIKMKEKRNLGLFIDCTPINIGRDIELLKAVSKRSEVDIVCSTGFYYNDEPVLYCTSAQTIADYMIEDAEKIGAGVIKAAVENENLSDFNIKLLKASSIAQKKAGLPIILHTNANNRNGQKAVEILLEEGVAPNRIVVGHLSDTSDAEYIISFAKKGCFVALDRMYGNTSKEYISSKTKQILELCNAGFENQILLSHDDAVFQGFNPNPHITEPRYDYIFNHIIPNIDSDIAKKIMEINPIKMLCGTL